MQSNLRKTTKDRMLGPKRVRYLEVLVWTPSNPDPAWEESTRIIATTQKSTPWKESQPSDQDAWTGPRLEGVHYSGGPG